MTMAGIVVGDADAIVAHVQQEAPRAVGQLHFDGAGVGVTQRIADRLTPDQEHFFGRDPRTLEMVRNLSDDDIWRLNRGGHDPHKVYAAYHAAVNTQDMPTVILAKTVKGYGLGEAGEGRNITHQAKPSR